ncbi:methylated-DNA--[protein]-cysteine S-methyltransferase [Asaia lannensis]|uniref:bifunctional transcriptional activator/DNA repair enzyme AdaA n=1 Tax=Asaia lannensis TaxID=415421 RepID=UPI0021BD30E7
MIARDSRYEGRAFVCVGTTGIFCRLTCPARKPLTTNCTFHGSVRSCIEAGLRPCECCDPLGQAAASDPVIASLLIRLEAGFDSPSAFREAFSRLLGCPPAALQPGGMLQASWIPTPLGDMIVVASTTRIHLLEFVDRKALPTELLALQAALKSPLGLGMTDATVQARAELEAYFAGNKAQFTTPLAPQESSFTRRVHHALCTIPAGETRSYAEIARAIGQPSAVRAVARANGANRIALMIPCHRVIGADGSLTGYGGGLWRKQRLIDIEQRYLPSVKAQT